MFEEERKLPHATCRSANWHLLALASPPRGSLFIFSPFPALPLKLVLMGTLWGGLLWVLKEGIPALFAPSLSFPLPSTAPTRSSSLSAQPAQRQRQPKHIHESLQSLKSENNVFFFKPVQIFFFFQAIHAGAIRGTFFKQAKFFPKKIFCNECFQAAVLVPALHLSEKLTRYIRLSIKRSAQHFPCIDPIRVCISMGKFP